MGVLLQLANVLSTEALFYTCIIPFICFFGAFAFVFYPLRDVLHPTGACLPVEGLPGCGCQQLLLLYCCGTAAAAVLSGHTRNSCQLQ